jgi:hypothetical protein
MPVNMDSNLNFARCFIEFMIVLKAISFLLLFGVQDILGFLKSSRLLHLSARYLVVKDALIQLDRIDCAVS